MRNIKRIKKECVKVSLIPLTVWTIIALLTKNYTFIPSAYLGAIASYIALENIISAQNHILQTKDKKNVFLPFLNRLGIYAIPLSLSLYFKNYLTFPITLVFLFTFQLIYITLEVLRHIKKLKKRRENG